MKKHAALLVILIVSGLLFTVSSDFGVVGASSVAGIITSDTTWTKSMSPISLTGQTAVNAGVMLTVEAGTVVNLNGYYMQVNGTLIAQGTAASPIYFNNGTITFTAQSNGWNEQTGAGSIIENAVFTPITDQFGNTNNSPNVIVSNSSPKIISIANATVEIDGGSPILSQSNIYHLIIKDGLPTVSHNTISSISLTGGSPLIDSNSISNGINPQASSGACVGSPIITGNTICITGGGNIISLDFNGQPLISNNELIGGYTPASVDQWGRPTDSYYTYYGIFIGSSGVSNTGGNAFISNNLITGFTMASIVVLSNNPNAELTIQNNTLVPSSTSANAQGILVNAKASPKINFNNIQGGVSLKQLGAYSNAPLTAMDVNATYNWWGTTDADAITQSIYDFKNDFNLGNVTFTPFLTSPNPQAPVYTPPATPSLTPTETPSTTPTQIQTPTSTATPQQTGLFGFGLAEVTLIVLTVALVVLAVVVVVLLRNRASNPVNA